MARLRNEQDPEGDGRDLLGSFSNFTPQDFSGGIQLGGETRETTRTRETAETPTNLQPSVNLRMPDFGAPSAGSMGGPSAAGVGDVSGPASSGMNAVPTPPVPRSPQTTEDRPATPQFVSQPSVTQPVSQPVALPRPAPSFLVSPTRSAGLLGSAGGQMGGGFGTPGGGSSGPSDPSALFAAISKLFGGQ